MSDLPKIQIPLGSGGNHKSGITIYAAAPHGGGDAILLGWDEEGESFEHQVEVIGSSSLMDYGLDEPPSRGVWVFEGEMTTCWSRGGDPFEPQDYDCDWSFDGEWRDPTDQEMGRWQGHKTKHITYDLRFQKMLDSIGEVPEGKIVFLGNRESLARNCGADTKEEQLEWLAKLIDALFSRRLQLTTKDSPDELYVANMVRPKPPISLPPVRNSEFCSCGKHFSECTCGEAQAPRSSKGKKGPWGLPWRPIPSGYDKETFYK